MLMTFGIPAKALPVTATGDLKLESYLDWLAYRRKIEGLQDDLKRIIVPGPFDVLVGRGRFTALHPGNLRYRQLIQSYMEQYEVCRKRIEKTELTSQVVQIVHNSSGRFLRQDGCGWVEIDDDAARDKVGHSFRNLRMHGVGNQAQKPAATKFDSVNVKALLAGERVTRECSADSKRAKLVTRVELTTPMNSLYR